MEDTRIRRVLEQIGETPIDIATVLDGELQSVNTLDFKKKKKMLIQILVKDDTLLLVKLKIANFFCNKLACVVRLDLDTTGKLVDNVYKVVYEGEQLSLPTRLYYMRFQNETVPFRTSVRLYENNVRNILSRIPYFQILKYIIKNSLASEEIQRMILDEFEALFTDPNVVLYIKMEIADIFILNNREERGHEMVNIIRVLEAAGGEIRDIAKEAVPTVYDDSQNVHDGAINKSVLKTARRLIQLCDTMSIDTESVEKELVEISPKYAYQIHKVLERVEIDTSSFKYELDSFSLHNVFSNLWVFINKHEYKEDLKLRLIEEMIEMALYCSTGHLSRFMNVIQGFTEDEELCVRISNEDQIKSVVSKFLEKILQEAPDKVLDSMIDTDQEPFYIYIMEKVNEKIPELLVEYLDIREITLNQILNSVCSYTKCERYFLKGEKISLGKNIVSS